MGVVLWELLAGRRLLLGGSVHETLQRVLDDAPLPRLSSVGRRDCPLVDAVIARALERDREKRWPAAAAMGEALEESLAGTEPISRRGEVARVMASLFEKHRDEERQTISHRIIALGSAGTAPPPEPPHADLDDVTDPTVPLPPSAFVRSEPPPARGRRFAWALAGALFAAGAAGALFVMGPALVGAPADLLTRSARAATQPVAPPASPAPACPAGMIHVPGGSFYMGNDEGVDAERPAHKVTLSAFCMDELEVTTADYQTCSARGDCERTFSSNEWAGITDHEREAFDPLCNARAPLERANHPINCVDWDMARVYCAMQKKRLPTEAEWELAARGPDGRRYPWGDEEPNAELLNACGPECVAWGKKNRVALGPTMYAVPDGWPATAPVGSFPKGASRYGLKDMVGNVWEWVADWGGPYTKGEESDPTGPASGTLRVMRGGAWNGGHAAWVSPSFRFAAAPSMRSHGVGFRCAR
jgi:eukaryotic-like serine/threonine-protein kinase